MNSLMNKALDILARDCGFEAHMGWVYSRVVQRKLADPIT